VSKRHGRRFTTREAAAQLVDAAGAADSQTVRETPGDRQRCSSPLHAESGRHSHRRLLSALPAWRRVHLVPEYVRRERSGPGAAGHPIAGGFGLCREASISSRAPDLDLCDRLSIR